MKKILSFLIMAAVLWLARPLWIPSIGTFLTVPDRVEKADVIVLLRGEEFFRFRKSAELYDKNYAPIILLSIVPVMTQPYDLERKVFGFENLDENALALRFFNYYEVPEKTVRFTGKETTSTYEEAVAAREWMLKNGARSFILVTSTYHMRRALFLFRHVFKDTGIEIYHAEDKAEIYKPEIWWTRERDIRRVIEEYGIFAFNWVYYILLGHNKGTFDVA